MNENGTAAGAQVAGNGPPAVWYRRPRDAVNSAEGCASAELGRGENSYRARRAFGGRTGTRGAASHRGKTRRRPFVDGVAP